MNRMSFEMPPSLTAYWLEVSEVPSGRKMAWERERYLRRVPKKRGDGHIYRTRSAPWRNTRSWTE